MLKDQTLFGLHDKVAIAIERLRTFEPPEGFYLAFSGGKDSIVVHDLARQSGVRFDAHMSLTTVDPPEVLAFARSHYPSVTLHRPARSMWRLMLDKGFPPMRTVRYCCQALKESGGDGRFVLTGVRWEESVRRASRSMVEVCHNGKKRFLHPIIDWTAADVWEHIKSSGLLYPSLYDEGFSRIGCIGCPMAGPNGKRRDFARWPGFSRAYLNTFARIVEQRAAKGLVPLGPPPHTAEAIMQWWIDEPPREKEDDGQCMLDLWV
jgi:phosphoadenosine phosphosulfate reductase